MNRPLAIVSAIVAASGAAGAAMIGDSVQAQALSYGLAATAGIALLAVRAGRFAGIAAAVACSGLLVAAAEFGHGVSFPAVGGACLMMIGLGWYLGAGTDERRARAGDLEQVAMVLRRELYRMKKDAGKVSRGTVRAFDPRRGPAAAPDIDPPVASAIDAATFAGLVAGVSAALNEDRLVEALTCAARDATRAGDVVLYLLDRRADQLLPGRSADGRTEVVADVDEPLIRHALKSRAVLARADATGAAEQAFKSAAADVELAAPLFDRQLSAGVLVVRAPGISAADARVVLTALAAVGGLALANARLGKVNELTSRTDPLTGLPNGASVRELLDEKLARGLTSILLISADGITEVNQTYGRRSGDRTISALARLIGLEVGAEGVVGYCGGSTLLVVLPNRRGDPVRSLAERLLRRVPASLTAGPEGIARPLTISICSASALVGPADGLLAEAEKALAIATGNGGNRLVEALPTAAGLHAQR